MNMKALNLSEIQLRAWILQTIEKENSKKVEEAF